MAAQEKRKEAMAQTADEQSKSVQRPIKTTKKTETETINQKAKPVKQQEAEPVIDGGEDPLAETIHEVVDQASEAVAGVNLGTVFDAAETLLMEDREGNNTQQQVIGQSTGSCDSEDKAKKKKAREAFKKMAGGKR